MRFPLFILSGLLTGAVNAQDFTWWNELHGWDGVTHWARYMVYTPGMMGPNALPTPHLERGRIDTLGRLELGGRGHFARNERTLDAHALLHLPLANGRVAFGLDWMALEHYEMDSTVRDMRRARDRDGRGTSTGDVNLNTLVQLVPEREGRLGLLLRLRLRTASGNGREGARHTDAPGYSFDLSAGRWHALDKPWLKRIRPHATVGFLVYQTNRDDFPQNDGLLYGGGLLADHGRITSEVALAGFVGYLNEGDRPLELRIALGLKGDGRGEWRAGLWHGLNDRPWTTAAITYVHHFAALPW
jgi:hypothetical protein